MGEGGEGEEWGGPILYHPVTLRILSNILLQVLFFFFRVARLPFKSVRRREKETRKRISWFGLVPNLVCISLPVPVELFDFCLTVLRFIFFCFRELLSFKISKEIVFLISSFEMNKFHEFNRERGMCVC